MSPEYFNTQLRAKDQRIKELESEAKHTLEFARSREDDLVNSLKITQDRLNDSRAEVERLKENPAGFWGEKCAEKNGIIAKQDARIEKLRARHQEIVDTNGMGVKRNPVRISTDALAEDDKVSK